jgi:DNA-binding CsgD family transcriptional regulator
MLSCREREIMLLLMEGYRPKQIAGALGIAESTVRTHLRSILMKLRARTLAHAVANYTTHWTLEGSPGAK